MSVDHIMPRSLAKLFGWSPQEVNDLDNKQLLCDPHHKEKDRNVPKQVEELREILMQSTFIGKLSECVQAAKDLWTRTGIPQ